MESSSLGPSSHGSVPSALSRPAPPREPLRPAALAYFELPRRFGRYVLLRRIAKGGMGEVMLAAALGLEGAERPVIVKTIRSEHRTDKSFKARFLDEARVQAQLEHPGVAQVLEATVDDETSEPYVVVEYVDGRSLGDVRARSVSTSQRIAWHEAVAIIQLTAEALSHVHERSDGDGKPLSIVHRDLSPQNLMVSYGGEVKIIDFGTARGENRKCHTVSGVVYAKPGYVAPEVANGNSGDFRVDLYAIGVMLWELVCGRRFLSGEASEHMALVGKGERELPPISDCEDAPPGLDVVIKRLTSFDKNHRYARTKDAARELASLLSHAPPMASGERGVRGRVQMLMNRMFSGEITRARREFLRLVAEARKVFGASKTPRANTPRVAHVVRESEEGVLPGTRYKLLSELGRGQGSSVHKALHVDLDRSVAIKLLDSKEKLGETQLRREMRVLSLLDVPGVVRLRDVGRTADDRPFLVLELCEGQNLESKLKGGKLTVAESLQLTEKLLSVLAAVHEKGVIHRDLKPSNIIVAEDGSLTLIDFGIAIARDDRDLSEVFTPAPTSSGVELWGTPDYMAPEQAARPHEVDVRADLYAVGTMLYELLTGSVPFKAETQLGVIQAKAQGSPAPPSEVLPTIAHARLLDALVGKALARHASLRFSSAKEMRAEVLGALNEPERARTRRRKLGAVAALGAMTAGLLVLASTLTSSGTEFMAKAQAKVPFLDHEQARSALPADLAAAAQTLAQPAQPEPATLASKPAGDGWQEPAFNPKQPFIGPPNLSGAAREKLLADAGEDNEAGEPTAKPKRDKKKVRRAETKKKKTQEKRGSKKKAPSKN